MIKIRALVLLPALIPSFLLLFLAIPAVVMARDPAYDPMETPVFDPGAPPRTRIPIARGLALGALLEVEYENRRNFDLDKTMADDRTILEPLLSLALSYAPAPRYTFFLNVEASRVFHDDDRRRRDDETRLQLKQLFLSLNEPVAGLTVILGRQRLRDRREWVFDEELDGIRVFYAYSRLAFDVSVTERNDPDLLRGGDDERITNFAAFARFSPKKDREMGAYLFVRDDRSPANESPRFLGLQAFGDGGKLNYWAEAAHVRGHSGPNAIRGYGFDLGGSLRFTGAYPRPYATLGYAFGSGDASPSGGKDKTFRQTGLQENEARFHGVNRFKYYGELFDPELSNLHIVTAGVGLRPTRNTSADLLYHYYRQAEASPIIREARLREHPDGVNEELGQEIDLVAAYRSRNSLSVSLSLGYFVPGKAFPSEADDALFLEVKARYDF